MCVGGEGGYKTRDSMYVLNIVFLSSLCFRTPRLASQARPSPSGHKSLCKPSPSPSPSPAADGEGGTKFSGCTAAGVPSRTPETQTTASTIINPHSPRCPRPQPSLPRSRHPLARTTPRFPPGALSGPPLASDVDDTRRSFSSDQIGVQEYTLLKSEGPGPLNAGSPLLLFARLEAGTGASCLVITSVNTYLVQKRGYTRTAGDRELHATGGVGGEWK